MPTSGLCLAVIGAVLGSFQFGYHSGVINAPEQSIKEFMNDTEWDRNGEPMSEHKIRSLFSLIVAIFAVGGCIGGFSAGCWSDRFGRKNGLLVVSAIGLAPSLLLFFSREASSYEMIIIGRLLIGLCCGMYTGLTPLYLSEISTPNNRGALGVLHQLGIVFGLLVSQILGFDEIFGNYSYWNILLGLSFPICLFQLTILLFAPESPRYLLITRVRMDSACRALTALRGSEYHQAEFEEMKNEASMQARMEVRPHQVSMKTLMTNPTFRWPLFICVIMHLSQQLSGINGIFYYSTSLFKGAGLSKATAMHATSGVGAVMFAMTIVTIPLMDRAGRRSLHFFGLLGMFVFSILITITLTYRHSVGWFNTFSIVVSLLFVLFFALGPGSIPWLLVSEMFSQAPRSSAMAISVLVNWIANFLVGFSFPHIQAALGNYTFVPFSIFLFFFVVFTFLFLPETKNLTFEQAALMWQEETSSEDNGGNGENGGENGGAGAPGGAGIDIRGDHYVGPMVMTVSSSSN